MLSDVIRTLRKSRGISQAKLAEDLNMSQATVACWEVGTRRPDIELLPVIAEYFGITVDQLLGKSVDEETEEIWQLREEVRRDPDRRTLFDLARSADIKQVKQTIAVLDALKKTGGEDE